MSERHRAILAAVALVSACGMGPRGSPETIEPIQRCEAAQLGEVRGSPLVSPGALPDTVVVAITDSVDLRRAPRPRNDGERFVFRQLYETLVQLDCAGRLYSRLSVAWSEGDGDREWTITLWDGALFWDGTPVTTSDVIAAWRARAVALQTVASIASVAVLDDRVLSLTFPRMAWGPPQLLAAPVLAISKRSAEEGWPMGTGGYRIESIERGDEDGGLETIVLVPARGTRRGRDHRVEIRISPGSDPRDLIDEQVDVLFTRDPSALAYAAARSELMSVPLPWDRAYVLLVPAAADGSFVPGQISGAMREALARDATRSDARAATAPYWWRVLATSCNVLLPPDSPSMDPAGRTGRVVYVEDDLDAQLLAERLVALASGERPRLRLVDPKHTQPLTPIAAGVTRAEFARAVKRRIDLAYVLPIRRLAFDPCTELQSLIVQAPWLGSRTALHDAIVPLIDTRASVVMRRTLSGLTVDLDGTVVLPLP